MDRSLPALCVLNFLMTDVRDGLGPFLGVFLQKQSWSPAEIGFVMTIGGPAGMLAVNRATRISSPAAVQPSQASPECCQIVHMLQ